MIRIREDMDIIVLHACQVEFIKKYKGVLHVYIIVRNTVHNEETDILL